MDERRTPEAGENFDRLKSLLREMFQLDRGDLDFGLYRIMNVKAAEIGAFLDRDLLPQVARTLRLTGAGERERLEGELTRAVAAAKRLGGIDPEETDLVRGLRARLAEMKKDAEAEADVYDHLAAFFARYYTEGDFVSQRRYTAGGRSAYLIPYDGEEVKLHWANADQYYVKTTENYASYVFQVGEGAAARRARFEIAAADTSKDNVKEANGKQRRFVLARGGVAIKKGELVVRFEHRPLTENEKRRWPGNGGAQQRRINEAATGRILSAAAADDGLRALLAAPAPTEANGDRTTVARHVDRYTAKNSFDYFIHKDLGSFLRRELDLYLNTEVLNLDDLEQRDDPGRLDRALARVRATRHIGGKVIDFLAQLEEFQKRLWLKKKFVLETNWCVTLDRAPEALYPEIAANEAQRVEWIDLFAADEIAGSPGSFGDLFKQSAPPTRSDPDDLPGVAFLKANPYLVLDTRHFDRDFADRLLAGLSDAGPLDDRTDGLLVHGENFQALNLLQARYRGQAQCVYIDPPYNTGSDDFAYKDGYRHSSWISMMCNRLDRCRKLVDRSGGLFVSTDDGEYANLKTLLDHIWGRENFVADVIWNSRKSVSSDALISLATNHTTFFAADREWLDKHREKFKLLQQDNGFSNPDGDPLGPWKLDPMDAPHIRENLTYEIVNPATGAKFLPPAGRCWRFEQDQVNDLLSKGRIVFGKRGRSKPMYKRYLFEAAERGRTPTTLWDDVSTTTEATRFLISLFGDRLGRELIDEIKPKPIELVERCAQLLTDDDGIVLDFFAGSGTSGHAVVDMNRRNDSERKYVLIEMADYFDTILLPRMKKIVHSPDWKGGKPISRAGIGQAFKYVRLESYEDTMDNLEVAPRSAQQEELLAANAEFAEDYRLRYALEAETAGSVCLLGRHFADPFAYTLSTVRDGARRETPVDLPETFNLLIGLRIVSRRRIDDVLAITGTDAKGRTCLILWRHLDRMDAEALNAWFARNRASLPDSLDLVYVNGDHTLNAQKHPEDPWTAETIEPHFRELMFEADPR